MNLRATIECPLCHGKGTKEIVDHAALRESRKALGISLRKMAARIGISAPYLSDIELGRRACPKNVEGEYQKLFDIKSDDPDQGEPIQTC